MIVSKLNISFFIYLFLLIAFDFFVLLFSMETAIYIRTNMINDLLPVFHPKGLRAYLWIILVMIMIFAFEKIYFLRYDFWGDTKRLFKGILFSSLVVFTVISLSKISDEYSRTFVLIFFIVTLFFLPFSKRVFKRLLFLSDFFKIRVKVVASEYQQKILQSEIENNWYFGFKHNDTKYDMVLIASKQLSAKELQMSIKKYTSRTKDIYIIPYMDHLDFSHADIIDYSNIRLSAIHIENRLLNYSNTIIKYIFEKLLVLMLFPAIIFLHLFIAMMIKFDSNGTVFFKQKRLGRDGRAFSCYKYRSMYTKSDDILKEYLKKNPDEVEHYKVFHKYKNDPRITSVGKFLRKTSLDELPQFFNVLRGDMNLIGPRPYMVNEKENIGVLNEEIILKVSPGITGLWQVSGRNELSFQERVELDTWYIQNWSLWTDFVIFLKTIKVVLSKVGAK